MEFMSITRMGCAALLGVSVIGCSYATKDELSSVRAELQDVKRVSENALVSANDAQRIAEGANAKAGQTQEALNRSFRKSMVK